jgi:hypothetical protein
LKEERSQDRAFGKWKMLFTVRGVKGGAVMMNAIVVISFIGVLVGKCYYYSKYSHRR